VLLCIAATSCDNDNEFTIRGKIKDDPTFNLRIVYYNHGTLNRAIIASQEGKFEFHGNATRPTIVEIYDNDYRLIGRAYAVNGETIDCELDRSNPCNITLSGNKVVEEWSKFLRNNAETLRTPGANANRLIANYIGNHKNDIVSALLLVTAYDASENALEADSLMSSIAPEARPNDIVEGYNYMLQRMVTANANGKVMPIAYLDDNDSLQMFNPKRAKLSLLALSDIESGRNDSIVPALRRMSKLASRDKLRIVDLSMDRDTLTWRRSLRNDSAKWSQGWAAGAIAAPGIDRLGVPRIPYFIVCDSAGKQIYRGNSIVRAEKIIQARL
jgi:hypothetical protein